MALSTSRIVMLEPRRLAARAAASRMAETLGERVGETVGYRIRHDTRVGPGTRIEVVTEGVLTRMLRSDPALETVGLVVFDEFHERSIHADLGLALHPQFRVILRPELRILVMSATLEGEPVARLLGGAPIVSSEGRSFPVKTHHLPPRAGTRVDAAVAAAIRRAFEDDAGDILAFLPGAAEIRRAERLLHGLDADVIPLHGTLSRASFRTAPFSGVALAAERWCSRPRSPRPVSPWMASVSWWTAARRGFPATRRASA